MPESTSSGSSLEAPLPDHVRLSHDGADLVLDVRWFRPIHLGMLLFAIFWDGFIVFWYRQALSRPSPDNVMLWFPLLHVGAGLAITYSAITGLVNHTTVTVGGGAVDVKLGPLPWWGAKRVEAGDIVQVFCEESISRTRSGASTSYHLNVITRDQRKVRLASNLGGKDVALFLEQEIEKALGISDRKVPGELSK